MWFVIRRRSRRHDRSDSEQIEGAHGKFDGGSPAHSILGLPDLPEFDDNEIAAEIPTKERPLELFVEAGIEVEEDRAAGEADNDDMRHELDGNYRKDGLQYAVSSNDVVTSPAFKY